MPANHTEAIPHSATFHPHIRHRRPDDEQTPAITTRPTESGQGTGYYTRGCHSTLDHLAHCPWQAVDISVLTAIGLNLQEPLKGN